MDELSGNINPALTLSEIDLTDIGEHYQISRLELKAPHDLNSCKVGIDYLPNGEEDGRTCAEDRLSDPASFTSLGDPKSNIDVEEEDYSLLSYFKDIERLQIFKTFFQNNKPKLKYVSKIGATALALAAYLAYVIAVLIVKTDSEKGDYWCDSDGLLININIIALIAIIYYKILKPCFVSNISNMSKNKRMLSIKDKISKCYNHRYTVPVIYLIVISCMVIFLMIDTVGESDRLMSAFGIIVFLLFGFLFSKAPRKVIWRHVIWGMGLQFVIGLLLLRWSAGRNLFICLGNKLQAFLAFTDHGSIFVFGILVSEFAIFAFKVMSVILFLGLFVQVLYFYGVMQWIVLKLGWLLQVTIGTTACESVNASANIFLGMSEAPLLIKPYLTLVTKSELHAVLTGGFATIAGTVLAAYISFGVNPAHLLTASVMSAPAALAFSKLFYPEVEKSRTKAEDIVMIKSTEFNVLHAALEGISAAIPLVVFIGATLIGFIASIAFVDAVFSWSCDLIGLPEGTCTLTNIFGYVFTPVAWIMGVPWDDCYNVGQLIGIKTIINEFVAYGKLGEFVQKSALSSRAVTISTYALCGFSNLPAIGMQLGTLGSLVPNRKGDISKIVVRAMIAGTVACFLTACVAGTLISSNIDDLL